MAEPHNVDLNLLRLFERLMAERRVGRAAEALGLSQPAASQALAKLRRQLGDPLFVRSATGMVPTPRAEALAASIAPALAQINAALAQQPSFEAATSQRAFTIGINDVGEIYFLPRLMQHLAREAPRLRLSTVRGSAAALAEEMAAGSVALAIGLLPQLKAGFHQRLLFSQRYVCLLRQGHPLAAKVRLTRRDFCAAQHLAVVAAGTGHGEVDKRLERQGVKRDVRLTVPHFVAVGHILAGTDLLATVPQRLADRIATPFGLVQRPHPVALPAIDIKLFWHARAQRDPALAWLRQQVVDGFAE